MSGYDFSKKRLDLGSQNADHDKDLLKHYFIDVPPTEYAGDPDYPFMVGVKGSGKTALVKHHLKTNAKKYDFTTDLRLTNIDIARYSEVLAKYSTEWPNETQNAVSLHCWQLFFVINAMCGWYWGKKNTFLGGDAGDVYEFLKRDDWIEDEKVNRLTKICTWLLDLIATTVSKNKGPTSASDALANAVLSDATYKNAYKAFSRLTSSSKKTSMVVIDAVDDMFEYDEGNYETQMQLFRGMITAVFDLARHDVLPGVAFKAYIPSQIFDNLDIFNRNKVNALKYAISWDERSLKRMICTRLAHSLKRSYRQPLSEHDCDEIWWNFFPQKKLSLWGPSGAIPVDSFEYLISHTQKNPRDVIHATKLITENVYRKGDKKMGRDHIEAGLRQFSIETKQRVESEYKFVLPGVARLLEELADTKRSWSHIELSNLILQSADEYSDESTYVQECLQGLYDCGVIGVAHMRPKPPWGEREEVIYWVDDPTRKVGNVQRFVVHKGLLKALGIHGD